MEGISRTDIDQICKILDAKEHHDLSRTLSEYDIIPKLYAYTYFKKVFSELEHLKDDQKSINFDEFEGLAENNEKLQLSFFKTKTEVNKLLQFLKNGFEREKQFCDFDDSKFHSQTKLGRCQSEDHYEYIGEPLIPLTEEQEKIFDDLNEKEGGYYAMMHFKDNYNPANQQLKPTFYCDDETHKYRDEPEWVCESCLDALVDNDCDCNVSCDMDDDLD